MDLIRLASIKDELLHYLNHSANSPIGPIDAANIIRLAKVGLEYEKAKAAPAKPIPWLESEVEIDLMDNREAVYSLDKARAKFEVREICHDGYLVLNWDHPPGEKRLWLKFAVMNFYTSDCDGANTALVCVFHGEGPSDCLRECRHTYWGESGYIFYPNGELIAAAFKALSEFFDQMVPNLLPTK
jgi:hypothetical protein